MALWILDGRDLPIYLWGSHYAGSLASCIGALLFALFGVSAQIYSAVGVTFAGLWPWPSGGSSTAPRKGGGASGMGPRAAAAGLRPALLAVSRQDPCRKPRLRHVDPADDAAMGLTGAGRPPEAR
jgi:hypothetical protein